MESNSASRPAWNSSPETLGPTTSVRSNFTWPRVSRTVALTLSTVWAGFAPSGVWNRTIASVGAPNTWTCTSPRSMRSSAVRTLLRSTGVGAVDSSSTVPPLKSMPQFSPPQGASNGISARVTEAITARADRIAAYRANFTKEKLVLTGRILIRGHIFMISALRRSAGFWDGRF